MDKKDWSGNSRSAHAALGARNYANEDREKNDYYATDPRAVRMLLEKEPFSACIWECACGEGHIAEELKKHGYLVYSTDLIDRGYGAVHDFLNGPTPPHCGLRHHNKSSIFKSYGICKSRA